MSDEPDRSKLLEELEQRLEHRFRDPALLETALCHSSYAHERGLDAPGSAIESNERLEFLGDAVLALVVAEALYVAKPGWREGDLTRSLHAIVEGRSLSQLARSLEVGRVLRLGRTEESSGGREKASILENAMEALLGAIYLDAGLEPVERFVRRFFGDAVAADAIRVERDPKTELQETLMASQGEFPIYTLVCDSGVEGGEERFTVAVVSRGTPLAEGIGRTKRRAERAAAKRALDELRENASAGEDGEDAEGERTSG